MAERMQCVQQREMPLQHFHKMESIGMEVYILCCLLPLLAFTVLMVEIYRSSHNKRTVIDQLQFHDDDFLYTMKGLITIVPQKQTNLHASQSCKDGKEKQEDSRERKGKIATECKGKDEKKSRNQASRVLAGCTAGISRINLINRKILKKSKLAVNVCPLVPRRKVSKKEGREYFQPTELPTIVEGLQY